MEAGLAPRFCFWRRGGAFQKNTWHRSSPEPRWARPSPWHWACCQERPRRRTPWYMLLSNTRASCLCQTSSKNFCCNLHLAMNVGWCYYARQQFFQTEWRILTPSENKVHGMTPTNILFRGGGELWPLMNIIKLMSLPQPTYCSEGRRKFSEMIMMMMMMTMLMMISSWSWSWS